MLDNKPAFQLSAAPEILQAAYERGKGIKGAPFELKREDNGQVIARGLDQEDCQDKLRLYNSLPSIDKTSGADAPNMAWLNARDAVVTGLSPMQCSYLRMMGKTDLIEFVTEVGYEKAKQLTEPFEMTMDHSATIKDISGDKTNNNLPQH